MFKCRYLASCLNKTFRPKQLKGGAYCSIQSQSQQILMGSQEKEEAIGYMTLSLTQGAEDDSICAQLTFSFVLRPGSQHREWYHLQWVSSPLN